MSARARSWMVRLVVASVVIVAAALVGCSGEPPVEEGTGMLLAADRTPLACADPTVFSTRGQGSTWFVFCTGTAHVWKTTDWIHFSDERAALSFDFGDMPAPSQVTRSWWAPSVTYDAAQDRYVLWVSVIDGQAWPETTRSLAVLSAPAPLGPWRYERLGKNAAASGEMFIDPMIYRDHDGAHYLFWKRYGGGLSSRIMGAALDDSLSTIVAATATELMDGYDAQSWELNVRENPAVWHNGKSGVWHLLYSGAHWRDDTYATGHASSTCGPLCGWHLAPSSDRGVPQVVQAKGDGDFSLGGPGGAVWEGGGGDWIVYAAASRSASGDKTRYLHRDRVRWDHGAPYVDNPGHHPSATASATATAAATATDSE